MTGKTETECRLLIEAQNFPKKEEEIKLSPKDKLIQSYADMNNITFDEAKKVIDEGNFGKPRAHKDAECLDYTAQRLQYR